MIRVSGKNTVLADFKRALTPQVERKTNALVQALAAATPVDTGEAAAGWRRVGATIVNDVDHISDLNAGSSKQARPHFVEVTLLQDPSVHPNGSIVTTTAR